jgi:hypothetical protein
VWSILGHVFGIIGDILVAGAPIGDSMLADLDAWLGKWDAFLSTDKGREKLREWIDRAVEGFYALIGFVGDLVAELLTIGEDGQPIMDDFEEVVGDIKDALPGIIELLRDMGTIIGPLAATVEAFGRAWNWTSTVFDWLGKINFRLDPGMTDKLDKNKRKHNDLGTVSDKVFGGIHDWLTGMDPDFRSWGSLWTEVKEEAQTFWDMLKRFWTWIEEHSFAINIDWPDPPDWVGKLGDAVSSPGNPFDGRWTGGPVRKGEAYVVGENRPELFVPSQSGRIMPYVPEPVMGGGGGGLSDAQLERVLQTVMDRSQPDIDIEQNFYERVDPQHVGAEMVWRLGR